jgi:dihydrofolate synthase/folylpolyglutamate synthase
LKFSDGKASFKDLPMPALEGANQIQNAAGALAAIALLRQDFPVFERGIARGLQGVRLTGRFECVKPADQLGAELTIDVGHNPNAAEALAENLRGSVQQGEELWAVFGMLADKDMQKVAEIVRPLVSRWFVASLSGPRAASAEQLCEAMRQAGVDMTHVQSFDRVDQALQEAFSQSRQARCQGRTVKIIGFGSFVTVSAILEALKGRMPVSVYP